MDFFNKINDIKNEGLEIFYITVSGYLFIDFITLGYYKLSLEKKFSEFTIYEILVITTLFFCLFYFTKVIRFIIVNFIVSRFSKNERHYEYYNSNDLIEDAVHENNSVKFDLYNKLKKERKKSNNLKHLNFLLFTMIATNAFFENSAIQYISGFQIALFFLITACLGFLFYGLQENEDEYTTTLIRKEKRKPNKV